MFMFVIVSYTKLIRTNNYVQDRCYHGTSGNGKMKNATGIQLLEDINTCRISLALVNFLKYRIFLSLSFKHLEDSYNITIIYH